MSKEQHPFLLSEECLSIIISHTVYNLLLLQVLEEQASYEKGDLPETRHRIDEQYKATIALCEGKSPYLMGPHKVMLEKINLLVIQISNIITNCNVSKPWTIHSLPQSIILELDLFEESKKFKGLIDLLIEIYDNVSKKRRYDETFIERYGEVTKGKFSWNTIQDLKLEYKKLRKLRQM